MLKSAENCSDTELLERIIRGDRAAFSVLYDRHSARLYGLAMKLLSNEAHAADVLQDVFLAVWNKRASYSARRGHPVVWLSVMCRNRCIDVLRSRKAASRHVQPWDMAAFERFADPDGGSPLSDTHLALLRENMRRALDSLPAEQRTVITLAIDKGYSQSEIAKTLAIPLGTVKSRVRLAMQRLRQIMTEHRDSDAAA